MNTKGHALLKIGEVAKQAGVNVQTVRYYERRGILIPAERMESGYRLYGPDAVRKLRFIKNAQELGFSLSEMASLLRLRVDSPAGCDSVLKKAEKKLKQVADKIAALSALRRTLEQLITDCRRRKTTDRCPILRCLDSAKGERR